MDTKNPPSRRRDDTQLSGRSAEAIVFDVLANAKRRRLLRCLVEDGPTVPVDALASALADRPSDADDDHSAAGTDSTAVTLVHTHLPKLAEAGLIQWAPAATEVRLTSLLEELSLTTPATGNILDATVSHTPASP
jgi:hypothetical protein